jgi:hypothetical protein
MPGESTKVVCVVGSHGYVVPSAAAFEEPPLLHLFARRNCDGLASAAVSFLENVSEHGTRIFALYSDVPPVLTTFCNAHMRVGIHRCLQGRHKDNDGIPPDCRTAAPSRATSHQESSQFSRGLGSSNFTNSVPTVTTLYYRLKWPRLEIRGAPNRFGISVISTSLR